MLLGRFPRVKLVTLPTPLEYAPRLSEELGVKIYMKRDDAMELAFGGNKVRKLEFLLADALEKGADTIITSGALCSNHARLTSAAARKLGLNVVLILRNIGPKAVKGNLLLDAILGADIRVVEADKSEIPRIMEETAKELLDNGRKPYIIPGGGANAIGSLGYLNASIELLHQLNELKVKADYLVHSTGSGATQTGLTLGFKALNADIKVLGIACGGSKESITNVVKNLADDTSKLVDLQFSLNYNEITVYDEYTCGGYGVITRDVVDAVKKVAKLEGVLLDPVYTGKAMMGLFDLVEKGDIPKGSTVVFLHTGGTPLIFQYEDELKKYGFNVNFP
ncbi:MAG: D-cysteine desulfhydrase family protein [archaeon GB-1867-005]|nr:D-cysteine desulfhydrase family protein [Candidatus Culexmicrobium cathedralense]